MLIGTICCSFRLFLFVFVGSTLLFSPVPVRKLRDVASFFGGGPLSTEVIVRCVRVKRSYESRAVS
jgi:hypothetical protein